jgi:integrative and conjugative element protein (TIGR02256 family)
MITVYRVLNYRIHISQQVIEIMSGFVQNERGQHESGGLLMGQVVAEDIYITRITIPNKFDMSGRNLFVRDKDSGQILLDYEFVNSGKSIIYLGEWHTHPEAVPTPSYQDRLMINEQFRLGHLQTCFLVMMILGTEALYLSFFDGRELHVAQCEN